MTLFISSMLGLRCKLYVVYALDDIGIEYSNVHIGRVELPAPVSDEKLQALGQRLGAAGLAIICDKRAMLVEKIKAVLMPVISGEEEAPRTKNSSRLSSTLHYDYTYLANVFSAVTGTSIEQYIIQQRVEKVKQYLCEGYSLTEISYKLNYCSVAHLSKQFKKVTGNTVTVFKKASLAQPAVFL
jgi:AraC-like DNA-binding protein